LDAFEFVSGSQYEEHHAYICRKTGRVYFVADTLEDEELPDDLESDQYLEVPRKHDLDLGANVPLAFVRSERPDSLGTVREMFSHRGAYRRFKQWLHMTGTLDKWYAFEQSAAEEALRDWCDEADVPLTND
jgi:hypothetical protein